MKKSAVLPDIDAGDAGFLAATDYACLERIGDYLLGTKSYARFGVTLLHSDFRIENDEILVEQVDADEDQSHSGRFGTTRRPYLPQTSASTK